MKFHHFWFTLHLGFPWKKSTIVSRPRENLSDAHNRNARALKSTLPLSSFSNPLRLGLYKNYYSEFEKTQ